MKKIVLAILATFMISSNALASSYWWGTSGSSSGKITVSYNGVDDVIGVYVLNERTMKSIANGQFAPQFEDRWNNANASGSFDLTDNLKNGANIVVVFVQNLVYTGTWGGKFAYSYSLQIGSKNVYSDSYSVRRNDRFLGHLAAILVIKGKNGSYSYRQLTDEEQDKITDFGTEINNYYGNQTADINWGGIISEMQKMK